MSRAYLAFLIVPALCAQDKPPAEVDEALRSRISRFYQAHVDGKFRLADELVADDTKDYFYEAKKTRFLSYEIQRIEYSENFTKALAIVLCEMRVMFPGFEGKPMKFPMSSLWKLEKDQWFWWVDTKSEQMTPFGIMKPNLEAGGAGGDRTIPSLKTAPSLESIWKSVSADKNTVSLSATKESSEEVVIANGMGGTIQLALEFPPLPGLSVQLDRNEVKAGEKAKVVFHSGERKTTLAKTTILVNVRVQPTNQVSPIQVTLQ